MRKDSTGVFHVHWHFHDFNNNNDGHQRGRRCLDAASGVAAVEGRHPRTQIDENSIKPQRYLFVSHLFGLSKTAAVRS